MEPLWSPGVATGGNQRQIGWLSEPQKQANSVATGCRQLRREVHGKQGVCRRLPPVAGGHLPAKEGVDLASARAISCCCSPGMGTDRNRSRCTPRGSCRECF